MTVSILTAKQRRSIVIGADVQSMNSRSRSTTALISLVIVDKQLDPQPLSNDVPSHFQVPHFHQYQESQSSRDGSPLMNLIAKQKNGALELFGNCRSTPSASSSRQCRHNAD